MHGVGGILGSLLVAFFASTELGVFSGYGFAEGIDSVGGQLKVQMIGIVATFVYTAVVSYALLKLIALVTPLRVTEENEVQGLDVAEHEETGYNL